jgi:pimeloyl-ACP methyl ester carboxylesterase
MTIVEGHSETDLPAIHLERSGTGPADLLLIHGIGSRGSDFARLISCLSAEGSVVAPDLRGHGRSAPELPVTVEAFAADLVPLLDREGPMVVAGFSFGSWVALELWRMRPGAVSAVVLVDPPLVYGPLFEWASRGGSGRERFRRFSRRLVRLPGLKHLRRLLPDAKGLSDGAVGRITAIYHADDVEEAIALMGVNPLTRNLDEADLLANARSLMAADRPTLLATLDLTGRPEDQASPAGSSVEPVVMFGEQSPMTSRESAARFADGIGGSAVSYEGGHVAHLEAPEAVATEIERHLPRQA